MNRTARRRAAHHAAEPAELDPADLRTRAGSVARVLVGLAAGCPDALSAERVVSDLAAAWTPEQVRRVALEVELDEPGPRGAAAQHAIAATLGCVQAAAFAHERADEGQPAPPWAAELGAWTPVRAVGTTKGAERFAFVTFDGAVAHQLAVGVFAGRRTRLGLLRPDTGAETGEPITLAAAADVLAHALRPGMTVVTDGAPDLRHLALRRLGALRDALADADAGEVDFGAAGPPGAGD